MCCAPSTAIITGGIGARDEEDRDEHHHHDRGDGDGVQRQSPGVVVPSGIPAETHQS